MKFYQIDAGRDMIIVAATTGMGKSIYNRIIFSSTDPYLIAEAK